MPALTGLRFIAAAIVVVSHFGEQGLIELPRSLLLFFNGGGTAVTLFFVLSGFILTYNYAGASLPVTVYARSRFARIYPLVVLAMLVATVSAAYAVVHPELFVQWWNVKNHNYLALAMSAVAQLGVITAWFPFSSIQEPWNAPAWSLACEAFFYACFPLLLRALRRVTAMGCLAVLVGGMLAQWILIVFFRNAPLVQPRADFLVDRFPVTHLFEFVLGIALGYAFLRYADVVPKFSRPVAIVVSVISLCLLAAFRPVSPDFFLMTPFFGLLVVGLALPARSSKMLLGSVPLLLLGEASYALYMLHMPMIRIFQILGIGPPWGWLCIVLVIGLSVAAFRWYEAPVRRRMTRHKGGSAVSSSHST